jgi:hypothetical protein
MKSAPRVPILNKKEIGMKFKEHIIVRGKTMDRHKVLFGGRNVQDIF